MNRLPQFFKLYPVLFLYFFSVPVFAASLTNGASPIGTILPVGDVDSWK